MGVRVVGVDHVQLAMPAGREPEARTFYSGLLGIPEIAKPPALAARGGVWFETGAVKIHLGVDPDFRPARKAHPGLLIHDLDSLIDQLRRARGGVAAGLAPHRKRPHAGEDPALAIEHVARQIVKQPVAAALGLERQHEAAVGLDVDVLDRVHLDGDGKAHAATF